LNIDPTSRTLTYVSASGTTSIITPQAGDMWINANNDNIAYIYVSDE